MDAIISASVGTNKYRTAIVSDGGHTLIADEPEALGGTNLGMSPDELLGASLASCSAITVRMYADRKQWPLDSVVVKSVFSRDENPAGHFTLKVELQGNLSDEQRERLLVIAGKCPIHKTLSNSIGIKIVST